MATASTVGTGRMMITPRILIVRAKCPAVGRTARLTGRVTVEIGIDGGRIVAVSLLLLLSRRVVVGVVVVVIVTAALLAS